MPDATVGEVLGLVEIIYAYGGKTKISFLAEELRMQLDDLGDAIDMAELLHLVKVKEGMAQLTIFGEAVNLGTINDKKRVLQKQLVKVEPFKMILHILRKAGEMQEKELLNTLKTNKILVEDHARFHKLILAWGGYANIFEYDGDRQVFRISV